MIFEVDKKTTTQICNVFSYESLFFFK